MHIKRHRRKLTEAERAARAREAYEKGAKLREKSNYNNHRELQSLRLSQSITPAYTFSYFQHVPPRGDENSSSGGTAKGSRRGQQSKKQRQPKKWCRFLFQWCNVTMFLCTKSILLRMQYKCFTHTTVYIIMEGNYNHAQRLNTCHLVSILVRDSPHAAIVWFILCHSPSLSLLPNTLASAFHPSF